MPQLLWDSNKKIIASGPSFFSAMGWPAGGVGTCVPRLRLFLMGSGPRKVGAKTRG